MIGKPFLIVALLALMSITNLNAQDIKIIDFKNLEERAINAPDTVFIINFWATWCAPCVKELPYFEQLAEKYKGKPLKVILLSLDFKSKIQSDLLPFVKKHKLKSEVLLSESLDEKFINAVNQNWSGAIPATLVIHHQKNIREFYEQEFTFQELESVYLKLQ